MARIALVGLSREQLAATLDGLGDRSLARRDALIYQLLYHRGLTDPQAMTELNAGHRALLAERVDFGRPSVAERHVSTDGTRKYLVRLADGAQVETVFIPDVGKSGALCVSSQVGCTLSCSFCHTGTQALVRNLTAAEIVGQLLLARDDLDDWPSSKDGRLITSIVFMGMGEPLYNLDAVSDAIDLLSDGDGIGIGRRRITVSTSGVVPNMLELGRRTRAMLAVSLHATHDELRNELVPINRKYNLETLFEVIAAYPGLGNTRRVLFEYVMLDGINDSDKDADALIERLAGIPSKVNLIPFNPWPGTRYRCSPWPRVEAFAARLKAAGFPSPIRQPRGRDILAACGQLRSVSLKRRGELVR